MPFLKTSREKETSTSLAVSEAFSLWKVLDDRYRMLEHLLVLRNYLHDQDFKVILSDNIKQMSKEVKQLEQRCDRFSITGPRPNTQDFNSKGNTAVLKDSSVAWVLYNFFVTDIATLIKIVRDSITNDTVREYFQMLLKSRIKKLYNYLDYLSIKGWISNPPLYQYVPDGVDERISVNEAYYLWSHLNYRYKNIYLTKVFSSYAYDKDLKYLFELGINLLQDQVSILEKTLLKYGVELPQPFPEAIPTPQATDQFTDEFMFLNIITHMKDAAALHSQAFFGTLMNKEVRKLFMDFTFEEIDIMDKLKKYGKTKGWTNVEPQYSMG